MYDITSLTELLQYVLTAQAVVSVIRSFCRCFNGASSHRLRERWFRNFLLHPSTGRLGAVCQLLLAGDEAPWFIGWVRQFCIVAGRGVFLPISEASERMLGLRSSFPPGRFCAVYPFWPATRRRGYLIGDKAPWLLNRNRQSCKFVGHLATQCLLSVCEISH